MNRKENSGFINNFTELRTMDHEGSPLCYLVLSRAVFELEEPSSGHDEAVSLLCDSGDVVY